MTALSGTTSTAVCEARPLSGLSVLSLGGSLAASLTARLLADQGADLLLAAEPDTAQPLTKWLSAGGRTFSDDNSADVVIGTHSDGSEARVGLRVSVLLRCFYDDDPQGRADWPCDDGLAGAAAGLFTDVNPFSNLLGLDPIYTALPLPTVYAAVHAATAVMMALLRNKLGGGTERIEVSLHGAMLSAMGSILLHVSPQPARYDIPPVARWLKHTILPLLRAVYRGGGPKCRGALLKFAESLVPPLMDSYRCADGRLLYVFAMDHARMPIILLQKMGLYEKWKTAGYVERDPYAEPGLPNNLADPSLLSRKSRARIRADLTRTLASRPAAEWESLLNAAGIACAVQRSTAEWRQTPHTRESGLLIEQDGFVAPGSLVWLSKAGSNHSSQDQASSRHATGRDGVVSVSGLRVLDLSTMLAGPVCARTLAEYGADVIKIDPPQPLFGPRMTCWYGLDLNRGKRSALLDLKRPDGMAAFLRLAADADVIVHNFRPGVLDRLGIGLADMQAVNPNLTFVGVSAYGGPSQGACSAWPGFDPVLQAATGIMTRYGSASKPALHAISSCVDYLTGFAGAFAAALAIYGRQRGETVPEAATSLAAAAQLAQLPFLLSPESEPGSDASGQGACGGDALHRLYRAQDSWIFVSADDADSLMRVSGLEGVSPDALAANLASAFARKSGQTWQTRFAGVRGVFVQPVTGANKVRQKSRELGYSLTRILHPSGFSTAVLDPDFARFSTLTLRAGEPAPKPGADTVAVLNAYGIDAASLLLSGAAAQKLARQHLPGN